MVEPGATTSLHIVGDSQVVVEWMCANRQNNVPHCYSCVAGLHQHLFEAWQLGVARPRTQLSPFFSHVYRRFNTAADALATLGMVKTHLWFKKVELMPVTKFLEVRFDGGFSEQGSAACGIHVTGCTGINAPWYDIASLSLKFDNTCSSTSLHAELFGAQAATHIGLSLMVYGDFELVGNLVKFPRDGDTRFTSHSGFNGLTKSWLEQLEMQGNGVIQTTWNANGDTSYSHR